MIQALSKKLPLTAEAVGALRTPPQNRESHGQHCSLLWPCGEASIFCGKMNLCGDIVFGNIIAGDQGFAKNLLELFVAAEKSS
jgi:hypothetical protein